MLRYFDGMRAVVEHHEGTVEKFIGDAVMAVFGIPRVHEDDALRAVRAAAEMRERLAALNGELEREWGVRLQLRSGVNTGEVVAGDPAVGQSFALETGGDKELAETRNCLTRGTYDAAAMTFASVAIAASSACSWTGP